MFTACSRSLPVYTEFTKLAETQITSGYFTPVKQWYDYWDHRDYKKIVSFLRISCQRGHFNVVELLLTADVTQFLVKNNPIASISWVNIYFNLGCFYGHLKVARCLIERIGAEYLNLLRGLEIASSSKQCPYVGEFYIMAII